MSYHVLQSQNTECMRGPKAFRGDLGSLLLTFFLFCLRSCSMGTNPLKVENIGFCIRQMQSRCVTLHWYVWISSTYGLCQMWSCILLSAMVCAGKSALFASDVSLFPPLHLLSFGWRSCFAVTNLRIRSEESWVLYMTDANKMGPALGFWIEMFWILQLMSVTLIIARNSHSSQNTAQCLPLLHICSLHGMVISEVP